MVAVAQLRVYEIAKEFSLESKVVMAMLQERGVFVRSASSTLEAPVARMLSDALRDSAALDALRSKLAEPAAEATTAEWPEDPEEVTADEQAVWERSDLGERDHLTEQYRRDAAERGRLAAAERDRRYQAAMQMPTRVAGHQEETSEAAEAPEEIGQLRNEIELATRAVMTAVSTEVTALRAEVAKLREQVAGERKQVAQLRDGMTQFRDELAARPPEADVFHQVKLLHQQVSQLQNELGKGAITTAKVAAGLRLELRCMATAHKEETARLRKQVGALKREVSDLSKQRDERAEEPLKPFYEQPKQPPGPYQPAATKPYRGATDLEYLLGETPRAIHEQEKARDFDIHRYRND
ncbi:translation initiation factor IF-2 N-terminal domain-containing protein [Streptomyces sp. NPDC058286]|uniref:translation initiation factor IF-2 N-terminal domain-containing protein n=1 Tax=Streptomyces sp. NPDC058286 TaxID=3346422 RepID=UPI0036F14859